MRNFSRLFALQTTFGLSVDVLHPPEFSLSQLIHGFGAVANDAKPPY